MPTEAGMIRTGTSLAIAGIQVAVTTGSATIVGLGGYVMATKERETRQG